MLPPLRRAEVKLPVRSEQLCLALRRFWGGTVFRRWHRLKNTWLRCLNVVCCFVVSALFARFVASTLFANLVVLTLLAASLFQRCFLISLFQRCLLLRCFNAVS